MKLTKYIPAILTLFIILGIATSYYFNPSQKIILGLLVFFLIVLSIGFYLTNKSFKQSLFFSIIAYCVFFIIGVAAVNFQNQKNRENHYSHFIEKDNKMILILDKKLKSNTYYDKYIATVLQLNNSKTLGSIIVNIQKDTIRNKLIEIGNEIYVQSNLKEINKPLNPYQFDYQKYLKKQQVFHQINIKQTECKLIKRKKTLNYYLTKIRININVALKKHHFKKDELAIINAIILGQRQKVSKGLMQSYAEAGAIHILAVSGLHIGILLLILSFILKPIESIKKGKTIKVILIILFLWLYAFLAGLSPSVIRAVTMFTAISIGAYSNKKTSTIQSLFISMFVLLLINPLYLFSVGFQLSYLAVFSIVYFYPLFIQFYNPEFWLFKKMWQLFAVSVSAQLGILPLSLYYFHQFPGLFFISSMVIIPFLGIILGFGILIIILALADILPLPLAHLFSWIINQMNVFIEFIAKQESFLFKNIPFTIWMLFTTYFIIFYLFWLWKKPSVNKIKIVLITILLFQGVLLYKKYQKQTSNQFIIFNQSKKNITLIRNGIQTNIFHNLDSSKVKNNYAIHNFIIEKGNLNLKQLPNKNIYKVNNKTILVVDSLGVYNILKPKIDYVVLQQSPKINLNRLIAIIKPKLIIADASNYKSYKLNWKNTCDSLQIDFHDTSVKGAFIMEY
ncbi:MAG TPA: ComEC family competence protein [Flavobacteriaceae bacterium]|nr:ComEC family competence protein [Flavobacteriaceae bacterium]